MSADDELMGVPMVEGRQSLAISSCILGYAIISGALVAGLLTSGRWGWAALFAFLTCFDLELKADRWRKEDRAAPPRETPIPNSPESNKQ